MRVVFADRAAACQIGPGGATLGRKVDPPEADILFDDGRMSRRHARIERAALGWRLVDLGSRNGSKIDGVAMPPQRTAALRDGSVVRLGDSILVFRTEPSGSAALPSPAFPGDSPIAARVRRRLAQLAGATGHVLVVGETGTGKERVARAIAGEAGPFVPQNCTELSHQLAKSELFGHLRNAFTGAAAAKQGLVEVAAHGVLFLDEIGDLPLDVQGQLLRFLDDGSYRPLGATEVRHSTARVVGATNVDLDEAVRRGTFRNDLLGRLRKDNAPLQLPPLRDRREDILPWAEYFLREAGATPARPWSAGVAECLLLYQWPVNLRELRGVVRGLVHADPRWPVSSSDLPEWIQAHRSSLRAAGPDPDVAGSVAQPAEPPCEQVIAKLVQTGGKMRPAAELLGIDRRKLYRLCERYGIDFESYRPASNNHED